MMLSRFALLLSVFAIFSTEGSAQPPNHLDRMTALHGARLRKRASLRTKDREEAEIRFAQFVIESRNLLPENPLVSDILDGYQNSRTIYGKETGEVLRAPNALKYSVAALRKQLGNLKPENLVPEAIRDYAAKRKASNGTILRDVGVLRAALQWAVLNRAISNADCSPIANPVPTPTPHVLRHTCATWLVEAGVSYEEIGKMLGDSAETVERIYGHHSPNFLKKASQALQLTVAA